MEIDKTTLTDLAILNVEDEFSIFSKLNNCRTVGGRDKLYDNFTKPLNSIEAITGIQQTLQVILQNLSHWPLQISNGSVMMIEKFYLATIDDIPANPSALTAYSYKVFHRPDFSLVEYSVGHSFDFIKGMQLLTQHFLIPGCPAPLQKILLTAQQIIQKEQFELIEKNSTAANLTLVQQLQLGRFLKYHYKRNMLELLEIYFQLDAWYGMAMAVKEYSLHFPELVPGNQPLLQATGLFHLLLKQPVDYDIVLQPGSNFLFLTGANMAGKSTFIKAVGNAVFLAHLLGRPPARSASQSGPTTCVCNSWNHNRRRLHCRRSRAASAAATEALYTCMGWVWGRACRAAAAWVFVKAGPAPARSVGTARARQCWRGRSSGCTSHLGS